MLKNDDFLNFDSDGDGVADSHIDFNNDYTDNVSDLWLIDADGDGIAEDFITTDDDNVYAEAYDFDGDGNEDATIFSIDTNNDGIVDSVVTELDLDGDGNADIVAYEADFNFDGKADYTEIQLVAGDNSTDDVIIRYGDTDFDGKIDMFSIDTDEDYFLTPDDMDADPSGDGGEAPELPEEPVDDTGFEGEADEPEATPFSFSDSDDDYGFGDDGEGDDTDYDDTDDGEGDDTGYDDTDDGEGDDTGYDGTDDGEGDDTGYDGTDDSTIFVAPVDYDTNNDNGTYCEDLENFDPDSADPDSIIGEPDEAMEYWEHQGNTNRCAIYSQKFVIEEYTGEEVDIEELCDLAEENDWFSEEGGTPVVYMDKLLDHYGIPNETSYGNDMEDIAESLSEGKRVIVAVDADEYWYGENDTDVYSPGDGINHAVEVIGIDNSDPENPMVIINDSGTPNGQGLVLPMETFMDAWEDGDCTMIECM